jgi:excisionase family DNA binding protein
MQAELNGTENESEWWIVEEVAAYFRVTPETVRRWVRGGKLQAAKPGRGRTSPLRIHQVEVERLAEFGRVSDYVAVQEAG